MTHPSGTAPLPKLAMAQNVNLVPQTFKTAIPLFLARFPSAHTRRSYLKTLESLVQFLQDHKNHHQSTSQNTVSLSSVTEDDLQAFRNHIARSSRALGRNPEPPTLARKVSTLRSFFAFARAKNWIPNDPSVDLRVPSVPRKSRSKLLTPKELGQIIDTLQRSMASTSVTTRNRRSAQLAYAVIMTLATTGLRVSELCNLLVSDYSQANGESPASLQVSRKGGMVQKLYLHPLTSVVLDQYLQSRIQNGNDKVPQPIFRRAQDTKKESHLTPKAVWLMVERAAQESGITTRPSPHSFRASLATEMHRQGILLHQIQDTLGHTNIATTELYVRRLNSMSDSPNLKLPLPKI